MRAPRHGSRRSSSAVAAAGRRSSTTDASSEARTGPARRPARDAPKSDDPTVRRIEPVRNFVTFVALGSAFATVEEFLTVVVLRHDLPSYLFTLLVLFPAYLSFVYHSDRLIDR